MTATRCIAIDLSPAGLTAGPDDYVNYLTTPEGELVFLQRPGENHAVLADYNREDDDWTTDEVRPEDVDHLNRDGQYWFSVCWRLSAGLRPEADPPATGIADMLLLGRSLPDFTNATCKRCGRPIRTLYPDKKDSWVHVMPNSMDVRSCAAASWDPDRGKDPTMKRDWRATPQTGRPLAT